MSSLVSIRPRAENSAPLSLIDKLRRGPVVDKFFLLGAIISFLGLGYLGSHLWLMRTGYMTPSTHLNELRLLHAELQLFVFFGLFIVGFCLQAGPRLLNVSAPLSLLGVILAAALPIVAVTIRLFDPASSLPPFLYAASFLIALTAIVQLSLNASRIPPFIPLLSFGLVACAVSCFLPITRPEVALLVLWAGVGSAVLGVWQVFIANLLGGKRLGVRATFLCALTHLATLISLGLLYLTEDRLWGVCAGAFGSFTLCLYFFATRGWRAVVGSRRPALQLATVAAFLWALSAWALLASSLIIVDEAFHVLATGFASSLVIALSLHIVGHLGGGEALSTGWSVFAISLWQLVPLMRGYSRLFHLPQVSASIVGIIATIVVLIWITGLVRCEIRILRRQAQLRGAEEMVRD
ncbi:MAG: hypothetical protein QY326_01650 [Bdellovibrionota bacterium]|nr:MAG: hypothetical protein QY326_01650 [Bdellovibrionota bacterium]